LFKGFNDFEGANPKTSLLQPTVIPDDDAFDLRAGRKLDQDASEIFNSRVKLA
jgi:hypothetical protein